MVVGAGVVEPEAGAVRDLINRQFTKALIDGGEREHLDPVVDRGGVVDPFRGRLHVQGLARRGRRRRVEHDDPDPDLASCCDVARVPSVRSERVYWRQNVKRVRPPGSAPSTTVADRGVTR